MALPATAVAAGAGLLAMPLIALTGMAAFGGPGMPGLCGTSHRAGAGSGQPSASPAAGAIPADYLTLYQRAGAQYGIAWTVLAGVGQVESGHGRSHMPGVHSGENYAGAAGPMQFLRPTWVTYAVDGDHDGRKDRYDPADAVPSAANMLVRDGAQENLRHAIWLYNHSWDYVNLVLSWAGRYGAPGSDLTASAAATASTIKTLHCPTDLAASAGYGVPMSAPAKIRAALSWALAQVGTPYVWGGECADPVVHPSDPHHQNCDCSSLVQQAWAQAGVRLPRTTFDQVRSTALISVPRGQVAAGDLLFQAGARGTAENPGHVGMYIGSGKVVAAPHTGATVRVEPYAQWQPKIVAIRRVKT